MALFDCLRENGADVPELSTADVLADPTGETIFESLDPTDPDFARRRSRARTFSEISESPPGVSDRAPAHSIAHSSSHRLSTTKRRKVTPNRH